MRADGRRLKNTDPMYRVAAHIMDKRVDSMNMITIDIPYEPMQEYLLTVKERLREYIASVSLLSER